MVHVNLITRRESLKSIGGVAAAASLGLIRDAQAAEPMSGIVDCHIHLWAADTQRFPFHKNAPYIPDQNSTLEQWLTDRDKSGIGIGIFVHGEPYQDDHRYVLHCIEREPDRMRGTVLFNPNAAESPRRMADLVKGRPFVAARVHATGTLNPPQWRTRNFEAFWEAVGELGLVLQMHMHPKWSREVEYMVRKYPDVRIIIDHLGRPRQGDSVDYAVSLGLSDYPNVYMKISSLSGQSGQEPPYANLKPLVKEIVRRFTPDRLVWGDSYKGGMGSPAYSKSIADTQQLLDFLSSEEQRRIFIDTPRRLFRL